MWIYSMGNFGERHLGGFPVQYILFWETCLIQLLSAPSNWLLLKPDQFPSQILHPTVSCCCNLLTWWPVLLEVPGNPLPFTQLGMRRRTLPPSTTGRTSGWALTTPQRIIFEYDVRCLLDWWLCGHLLQAWGTCLGLSCPGRSWKWGWHGISLSSFESWGQLQGNKVSIPHPVTCFTC